MKPSPPKTRTQRDEHFSVVPGSQSPETRCMPRSATSTAANPYTPPRVGAAPNPLVRNARAKKSAITRVREGAAAAINTVKEEFSSKLAASRRSKTAAVEKARAEGAVFDLTKQPAFGKHGYLTQQSEASAAQVAGYAADALIPYRALKGAVRPSLFLGALAGVLTAVTSGEYQLFFRSTFFGFSGHLVGCGLRGLHDLLLKDPAKARRFDGMGDAQPAAPEGTDGRTDF